MPYRTYRPTPNTCPLSLHDALPFSPARRPRRRAARRFGAGPGGWRRERPDAHRTDGVRRGGEPATGGPGRDRKSTRLNSSHVEISYAVFCLKKTNVAVTFASVLEMV